MVRVRAQAFRVKTGKEYMKHNKNHDNVMSEGPQLEPVRFEFTHLTARNVCIAGSFNDWHAEAKPMHSVGDGRSLKATG